MALPALDRRLILEAMARFDQENRHSPTWTDWETKKNFGYAIVHDGRRYPVKEIISIATGTSASSFSGGRTTNSRVQKVGLDVEALHMPPESEVRVALHELLLARAPDAIEPTEAYDTLADRFALPQRLRTQRMEKSDEVHWDNRVRFARRKLVDAGIVDASQHGRWKLKVHEQRRIWVEKCLVQGRPDRTSGPNALGKALWSPTLAQDGADIYRNMRSVQPNDLVLHLTDNTAFTGVSIIDGYADPNFVGLDGTSWSGLPSYRVPLRDFSEIRPPLTRETLFSSPDYREQLKMIRSKYSNLFYDPNLNLHQGGYLTEAPPELVTLLDEAYRSVAGAPLPYTSNTPQEIPPPAATYSIDDFSDETAIPPQTIRLWEQRLKRKKQIIFQGPPGTGKTFIAERLARLAVSNNSGFIETLQFHPSYSYEDFMQGIRPVTREGQLTFEPVRGRFMQFCDRAAKMDSGSPCVLIIDEINRGNLSRIFGELMYLLEYRDKAIPLAGETRPFHIPTNVYLIGTMNTADRSIALVDHALRRRFSFIFLGPDYDVLRGQLERLGLPAEPLVITLQSMNALIGDRNYEIGISFFLKDGDALRWTLRDIWEGEIEPYLEEFFYDQPSKVDPFRWSTLVTSQLAGWNMEE